MDHSLFVYGTLMIPEIREALLKKDIKSKSAVLKDYTANYIIYGQYISEYPFLKPEKGQILKGQILYPLTGSELNLIKFYEGSEYVLTDITVRTEGKDEVVKTFMLKKNVNIEYGTKWDYEKFVREYLNEYIFDTIPKLLINYNM